VAVKALLYFKQRRTMKEFSCTHSSSQQK